MKNRETSGSTARIWALDGRRGGSDEGALVCSSQPPWQPDFLFGMCDAVCVKGRAGGCPGSYSTRKARLRLSSEAAEPDRWQPNTYKHLGEHPRSIHFTGFLLGLLKWLHGNSWVCACIETTVPSRRQQAAVARGTSGCHMEDGCT